MKRKIALLAAIVICMSILAYGTVAYFNSAKQAHNVITTCGVEIDLAETPDGGPGNPQQTDTGGLSFSGVMPGMEIKKQPKITNKGQPAYIRVKIEKGWDGAEGQQELDPDMIMIEISPDAGWITKDPDDGWYYYNNQVTAGDKDPVSPFSTVKFSTDMGNEYQNRSGYINVIVQAVQAANNGDSALSANGWPEQPQP